MPCFHPLRAFRSSEVHEKSGKHKIIFNPDSRKALEGQPALMLPCGRASVVAPTRRRRWASAAVTSRRCTRRAVFTLTYDDEHVPADYSVKLRDWQLFLKRTRKRARVRVCASPEAEVWRAGFEAALSRPIFQLRLSGQEASSEAEWSSGVLVGVAFKLWENKGSTELGSVTHASAAYVARYSMKKGDRQEGR